MTIWSILTSPWSLQPSIMFGCGILMVGYMAAVKFRFSKPAVIYLVGVVILLLTLVSPIDTIGETYLFSVHMLQHMLLVLVVPPLLLLGVPTRLARKIMQLPWVARLEKSIGHPSIAWLIGMGALALWHLPLLYNMALLSEPVHIVEHLTMLMTATIFWWPVTTPLPERRLGPLPTMFYLSAAGMASGLLGLLLAYSSLGTYSVYLNPPDPYGLLSLIRVQWGLSARDDQEIAGWLMLIPGGLIYIGAIMGTLARWYITAEEEVAAPAPESSRQR
ncbi:MAG: cytochrome c oxidase assembly protein [Chloroflexi bacterium]|nr:cytochrome c oxidase assembly protein [Chloroflexota bacterium]